MSDVSIKLTNNRIPELKIRFPQIVQSIVDKTAFDVERFAKEAMAGSKTGKLYKRGDKAHQASSPGEAPAMDTGNLANSVITEKPGPCEAWVGPHTEYAIPLEFGTEKMAPRPFMGPAAQKAKPGFLAALKQLETRLK